MKSLPIHNVVDGDDGSSSGSSDSSSESITIQEVSKPPTAGPPNQIMMLVRGETQALDLTVSEEHNDYSDTSTLLQPLNTPMFQNRPNLHDLYHVVVSKGIWYNKL